MVALTQWLLVVMLFGASSTTPANVHSHRLATLSDCERVGKAYRDMSAPKDRALQWSCIEVTK